jgi:ATP-dependent helicase/nuclease subunit B
LLPLKGKPGAQKNRRKALEGAAELNRLGYTHEGIYDVEHLGFLDTKAPDDSSGQFRHRITKSSAPHKGSFNALKSDEFEAILRRTEEIIRETGRRIFAGDISIWPYKLGTKSACEHCDYQAVCRFDSWVQKHRVLQRPGKGELE